MKNVILPFLLSVSLFGIAQQSDNITGIYKFDDGLYRFELFVYPDSTFEIYDIFPDAAKGKWSLINDSLFVQTFFKKPIIEKLDNNRSNQIIRVRDIYGFRIQTIIMINGRSVIKNTDKHGEVVVMIDTIKSIKVLEGDYPIFNISDSLANDITVYVDYNFHGYFFKKIFEQNWLVENGLIYAWETENGMVDKNKFFEKISKK